MDVYPPNGPNRPSNSDERSGESTLRHGVPLLALAGLLVTLATLDGQTGRTAYGQELERDFLDEPVASARSSETLLDWAVGPSDWESPAVERDRMVTDRPHVSEATSTVGLGRIQLETGYTYFSDREGGTTRTMHSFPEPLLRWGVLAEWFELRLGYNYLSEIERPAGGGRVSRAGSDDMLLAAKVALAKQRGVLPDLTIFPQFRLPTGSPGVTANRVLPGVNIAYSWAITELLEIECNTVFNMKVDDAGHDYLETLQTLNIEYDLSERWLGFTEFLAFMPASSIAAVPEYYFHYGIQRFITPNLQFDIHSAVGLNRSADNLAFTGVGLSWRY